MSAPVKFLLVGQWFHVGAQALLEKGLKQGARVTLRAESDNPYDSRAVRVEVEVEEIVLSEELQNDLARYGLQVATMGFPFMLGHLAASRDTKAAKAALAAGLTFAPNSEWHALGRDEGFLVFHGNGTVWVEVGR